MVDVADLDWTSIPLQDGTGSYWHELVGPWLLIVCPRDGRWIWSATSFLRPADEPLHGDAGSAEEGKRAVVQRLHEFLNAVPVDSLGELDRKALVRLDLCEAQEMTLLGNILRSTGADPREKDWAPVMVAADWEAVRGLPAGLVETHQRSCPIMGNFLGVGYVRLTDAGRDALAAGSSEGGRS